LEGKWLWGAADTNSWTYAHTYARTYAHTSDNDDEHYNEFHNSITDNDNDCRSSRSCAVACRMRSEAALCKGACEWRQRFGADFNAWTS